MEMESTPNGVESFGGTTLQPTLGLEMFLTVDPG